MNINAFATDENAEINGVWKDIGDGASIKVARFDNPAYTAMVRTLMEPYRSSVNMGKIKEPEADVIIIKALAKTVLLDWKGLKEVEEEDCVVYSEEKAIYWLTQYKEFKKIVIAIANDISNYRNTITEEVKSDIKK